MTNERSALPTNNKRKKKIIDGITTDHCTLSISIVEGIK